MRLTLESVCAELDGRTILSRIDLTAEPGEFVALIGPNGSGKSTLLRTVYRALKPTTGVISLNGENLWRTRPRTAAKHRAVVTQHGEADSDFTVTEVVAMGRTPHKRPLDRENHADRQIVADALARVGMADAAHRPFPTLSGGERQRVLIARALAQQAPLLILDEPTNHLDVRAQLHLLDLIKDLRLTLLAALHDLEHATAYADRVVVLQNGHIKGSGPPLDVLTPDFIAEVFGVRAHIGPHPLTGRPHIALAPMP